MSEKIFTPKMRNKSNEITAELNRNIKKATV